MYNVAFRVDGSTSIGMGHITRCLSLAKEFKSNNYKVYFISKYDKGTYVIRNNGFEVIKLKNNSSKSVKGFYYGDKRDLEYEVKEIIKAIKLYNIQLLIVDSYNVTEKYFLELKNNINKLGYIDDINKFTYPVDILINGNIYGEIMDYKKYFSNEIMLLGSRYNLIRDEFKNLPNKKINKEIKDVMITTGGSDPYNITTNIINMFSDTKQLNDVRLHTVVGRGFTNKKELKVLANKNNNIILYEDVKYMSKIMLKCDLAISSGGSTLYELCSTGTPTITFIIADNQINNVEYMKRRGYMDTLGWYSDITKENLLKMINNLYGYKKRFTLSKKTRNLVDGNGTKRIVKEVSKVL